MDLIQLGKKLKAKRDPASFTKIATEYFMKKVLYENNKHFYEIADNVYALDTKTGCHTFKLEYNDSYIVLKVSLIDSISICLDVFITYFVLWNLENGQGMSPVKVRYVFIWRVFPHRRNQRGCHCRFTWRNVQQNVPETEKFVRIPFFLFLRSRQLTSLLWTPLWLQMG